MRILVCGGRSFQDYAWLSWVLDSYKTPDTVIISGMAKGADSMAARWASLNACEILGFYTDWSTHGKAAGPIRNQQMLEIGKPDLVIAFPGSRGTQDMVNKARKKGVSVIRPLREV